MESELFGHERGAFTSAESRRIGYFEQARRGTIFIDEIGDLPLTTQVKLLRVLQEKYIQRVGGNEKISMEARVVSATHRDLYAASKEKQFREDLFYRLAGLSIRVPCLNQRLEDIPELVNCFVQRACARTGTQPASIEAKAIDFLQLQTWEGNVRELENVIEQALLLAGDHSITLADVHQASADIRMTVPAKNRALADYLEDLLLKAQRGELRDIRARMVEEMERELFILAIRAAQWNQAKAARWLGVGRRTLRERLVQFRMHS